MSILLIQPPMKDTTASVTPPLGLAYLAAVLEKNDIQVRCLLADVERLTVKQIVERVYDINPLIVGISTTTPNINSAIEIVRLLKQSNLRIITVAGGAHATCFPLDLLEKGFDYVVMGEGEETILELFEVINGNRDASGVPGLAYFQNGQPKVNDKRPFIQNLDNLPFPAWHLFPLSSYKSDFKKHDFFLPIITSRGCPGSCIFCYKELFGNQFRLRSPENIISEISFLIDRFHMAEFSIIDDNFTTIPKRVFQFCDLLKRKGINLPWTLSSGIRVDTASKALFRTLKSSGCYRIGFGIESGNEEVLKGIKKNITKESVRFAVQWAKEAGLEVYGFFMIGNLGESPATVDDTINFAKELDLDIAQFSVATPFPGSEMYRILKKGNRMTTSNWDDFDYLKTNTPCFRHENLSKEVIARKMRQAYRQFYFRPKFILKKLCKLASSNEFIRTFRAFLKIFKLS